MMQWTQPWPPVFCTYQIGGGVDCVLHYIYQVKGRFVYYIFYSLCVYLTITIACLFIHYLSRVNQIVLYMCCTYRQYLPVLQCADYLPFICIAMLQCSKRITCLANYISQTLISILHALDILFSILYYILYCVDRSMDLPSTFQLVLAFIFYITD